MADLCQTAGRGICSDHSGSVALLVQATKTIMDGLATGRRLYVSFRHGTINPSVRVSTNHGLTGASTFFYIDAL